MISATTRLKLADEALSLCKIASHKPADIKPEHQARAIRAIARLDRADMSEFKRFLGMDDKEFRTCLQMARTPVNRMMVLDPTGFSPVLLAIVNQAIAERDALRQAVMA